MVIQAGNSPNAKTNLLRSLRQREFHGVGGYMVSLLLAHKREALVPRSAIKSSRWKDMVVLYEPREG